MHRFNLILSTFSLVAVAFCVTKLHAQTASKPPNILILYADDLGYGDLRVNNPKSKIPTPNLNQLASEGMRFTDGHSSSGICTPSRYALLTGRHHWRDFHGIVGALGESVFDPQRLTMPEMLQQNGYTTSCIGKWHLGWNWDAIKKPDAQSTKVGRNNVWGPEDFDWSKPIPGGPLSHGFDYYFGDTVINFPPYAWIENDRLPTVPTVMMDSSLWKPIKEGNWECRPGPMVEGWNPYDVIPTLTKQGVKYIHEQAQREKPFFLYFAFPSPHAPIIPNDVFDGKSEAGAYGDFVFETDDAAGQLLQALKDCDLDDNTIIIFSADNGPEKYAYARDAKYDHWSAEPFRGLKRDIYEGGHHVPFVIKWPGKTVAGSTCDSLVSQIDIMATLAAFLQIELPMDAAEDSHNLLPLLSDPTQQIRTTHVHNTQANQYAIRHENWLLIDNVNGYHSGRNKAWESKRAYPSDDDLPYELYDLAVDIGQTNNVANQHIDLVQQLQSRLVEIRANPTAPR